MPTKVVTGQDPHVKVISPSLIESIQCLERPDEPVGELLERTGIDPDGLEIRVDDHEVRKTHRLKPGQVVMATPRFRGN